MEGLREAFKVWWWQLSRWRAQDMIWRRKLGDEGAGLLPAPWEVAGVSEWEYWSGPSHRRPSHRIRRWHTVFGGTWDYGLARAATEFILGMLCWERRRGGRDVRLPVWGMRDPWSASARFQSAAALGLSSRIAGFLI